MKLFNALVFATAAATSAPAFAVDLRDASNGQIFDELQRRIDGGTGGNDAAITTFLCDSYGTLKLSSVGNSGSQQDYSLYMGTQQACQSQATPLAARRQRITRLTLVALCDPYANMKKLSLKTDGSITELDSTYFGTVQACLDQAGPINNN